MAASLATLAHPSAHPVLKPRGSLALSGRSLAFSGSSSSLWGNPSWVVKAEEGVVASWSARKWSVNASVATAPPKMSKVFKGERDRRLQTQTYPIAPETTTIRSLDWDRDRFDIEFGLQNGTTYNSFIVKGEKTAVIDASHEKFRSLYLSALKEEIDPSTIDYIVANHTEPDHSGLIADLLELAPNAVVVGSKVCIQFLGNLILKRFKSKIVKTGETLDLGNGHVLEFAMAPNLHWPDTIFTLDQKTGVMFTCDAFGMHYCSEAVFDEDLNILKPHFRFYYDCLMKPNSRSVLNAMKRISNWNFSLIATGHGPLLQYNVFELMGRYELWSNKALEKQTQTVAMLYTSDYGYSDRLSQAIARGITKTNVGVEMVDLNFVETQELIELVGRCAAVVLLSPPHTGKANTMMSTLFAAVKPKQKVLVAESYGGDDEPVDTIESQFKGIGIIPCISALRVREEPSESTYQEYEEAGTDVGQILTKKEVIKERKSSMSLNIAKSIGRISGGLYIVTAVKGSSKGAMVASWVSQASFQPLGITIAVAKDRAIESLMQVGDSFVLNTLEEGNFAPLMKHFLKRFPPGADRFEGVNWVPGKNGSPVLTDALAYMECVVRSRMETNDHWITYAEVLDGNVSKAEGRTASHHRKIGDYY